MASRQAKSSKWTRTTPSSAKSNRTGDVKEERAGVVGAREKRNAREGGREEGMTRQGGRVGGGRGWREKVRGRRLAVCGLNCKPD